MELSGELFKSVVAQLKGTKSGSDLRAEPRAGLRKSVTLQLLNESEEMRGKSHAARVRDLSPHGIGLIAGIELQPDSLFALRLPMYGGKAIVAVYRVSHSQPLDGQMFSIGARLVKVKYPEGTRTKGAASKSADQALKAKAEAEAGSPPVAAPGV